MTLVVIGKPIIANTTADKIIELQVLPLIKSFSKVPYRHKTAQQDIEYPTVLKNVVFFNPRYLAE